MGGVGLEISTVQSDKQVRPTRLGDHGPDPTGEFVGEDECRMVELCGDQLQADRAGSNLDEGGTDYERDLMLEVASDGADVDADAREFRNTDGQLVAVNLDKQRSLRPRRRAEVEKPRAPRRKVGH